MNLQAVGKVDGGIGQPPDAYVISDKLSLAVPGLTLSGLTMVALPLDMTQQCLGRRAAGDAATRIVDGILGYSFFRGVVVEIDYDALSINLYAPANYRYAGRGKRISLEMDFNEQPATRGYNALLGNPALQHFKVVFDYSRRDMILEPRKRTIEP